MANITYNLYKTDTAPFERMVDSLLHAYRPDGVPVRFVFFGDPADNHAYADQLLVIEHAVNARFGEHAPVFSYVAQPPCLPDGLILEAHEIHPGAEDSFRYERRRGLNYIAVENPQTKRLFVAGIQSDPTVRNIRQQSAYVFRSLEELLQYEQLPKEAIVRQWNYIECITELDSGGRQHYQIFNDARSRFYLAGKWPEGYPAATGIGTRAGGVLVGLDAVGPVRPGVKIRKIDNPFQVAAHRYSQQVLIGNEDADLKQKTTPKFERAKAVISGRQGMVYISGTAAIRGEESLGDTDIVRQTVMTCENIGHLISAANLQRSGIPVSEDASLSHLRVYLKRPEDQALAEQTIRTRYPSLPTIYMQADICREELSIEMEGAAFFQIR